MLIDVHGHPPRTEADTQRYLDALKRWDSRLLVASLGPRAKGWQSEPTVDDWRIANDECAQFVTQHPQTLAAYCYVNPAHTREALDELERRFVKESGPFVALKLWVAVRASDARLDPLMEFCAAHAVPVLQHTWMKVGAEGPGSGNLPGESTPLDLLALARRHPRVKFFGGHIGGDWEWGVAALKQVDNVFLDVAGGESAGAYAQIALRAVGAGRIVYGTDVPGRSVPSQLSKILCLDVSSDDLDRMLWKNAAQILGDRLPAAWGVRQDATAVESPNRPIALTSQPAPAKTPLIDVNAFLGDWPSRRVGTSPEDRLRDMDLHGIQLAVVSPLEAVFLKDVDAANRELHAQLVSAGDSHPRLLPAYVLNPTWPAWEEQLDRCVADYGLAAGAGAVRLVPGYHGYRIDDESLAPFFERIRTLGVPVIVTVQLEDARMHHFAMRAADVPLDGIAAAVTRYPGLRWIVANCTQTQIVSLGKQLPAEAKIWFDVARVQGPIDCFRLLADAPGVGAGRLVFGTNSPLLVPESPIMELADARFSSDQLEAIARGNAARLFGLS